LGSINGINGATADTRVGIGTTAPATRLHVSGTGIIRARVDSDSNAGLALTLGNQPKWSLATVTGGNLLVFNDALGQTALSIDDATNAITINALGSAGSTQLCRNASNQIATCSSSLRYKLNVQPFAGALEIVNQLRPVTFSWKAGGARDLGLVAEEVFRINPLLVIFNTKGEVEGVKYDRLNVVLINAVKQQQRQIEQQQDQINDLKKVKAENAELRAQLSAISARLERLERRRPRRR
jgi:hypothetical protein